MIVDFGLMLRQLHPDESCDAAKAESAGTLTRFSKVTVRFSIMIDTASMGESSRSFRATAVRFTCALQVLLVTVWVKVDV